MGSNHAAMDGNLCFLDMLLTATFDLKGVKTVRLRTTGNEKLRFGILLFAGVHKIDINMNQFPCRRWLSSKT